MKECTIILICLITYFGFAQIAPADKGFEHYSIASNGDTINFFIRNPEGLDRKKLFIHVDGSYPAPLWIESSPCCVTLDPFNYDLIPKEFAYVVISKHGFPFSAKENFKLPENYWIKNTLDFRVKRVNKVINYIQKYIFLPEEIVLVGTSQGTDVVAKLATINKDISKIGFWAGGGHTQLMEFIMFTRKEAISGKITEIEASKRIDSLLVQFKEMFKNPTPEKMWEGNSYLSYVSFSEPPLNHLLKLDIPIYMAIGSKDENVAIENAYIIPVEFIRQGKENLTFRHFPNYDHGFIEKLDDGTAIDRFDEVTLDFLKWIEEN